MSNFSIEVKVNIGVTSELTALLMAAINGLQRAPEKSFNIPSVGQDEVHNVALTEPEPSHGENNEKTAVEEVTGSDATPLEQSELTTADIRAAMDKVRRRIEGEDYKNQTTSEPYKKFHQQLSKEFIRIANICGADKPSNISTQDGMRVFIKECDDLVATPDGRITVKLPF